MKSWSLENWVIEPLISYGDGSVEIVETVETQKWSFDVKQSFSPKTDVLNTKWKAWTQNYSPDLNTEVLSATLNADLITEVLNSNWFSGPSLLQDIKLSSRRKPEVFTLVSNRFITSWGDPNIRQHPAISEKWIITEIDSLTINRAIKKTTSAIHRIYMILAPRCYGSFYFSLRKRSIPSRITVLHTSYAHINSLINYY